jgi:hypothetical protein
LFSVREKRIKDFKNECLQTLRERGHWGDPDVGGRIILRWIFRKLEGVVVTGWNWLRIGTVGGNFEYGKQTSGSIKMRGIS